MGCGKVSKPSVDGGATPAPAAVNASVNVQQAPTVTTPSPGLPLNLFGHFDINTISSVACFGPWLKYGCYNADSGEYRLSALVVCKDAVFPAAPSLTLHDGQDTTVLNASKLDNYQGYSFYRYDITVQLGESERSVSYQLDTSVASGSTQPKSSSICIPGKSQPWHWAYYSCNGFHSETDQTKYNGIQPLWEDFLSQHKNKPFHLIVGGGDQLYNDQVYNVPLLQGWDKIEDAEQALNTPYSTEVQQQVEEFYFSHYAYHFSQPSYGDALASVPSMNTWDDHDIFDGWGSYPPPLMNCSIFQGVYRAARRFYLLFQQHTTDDLVKTDHADLFLSAGSGVNILGQLGSTTALLLLDTRSERSLASVMDPETWDLIWHRLEQLPPSVHHLVVGLPVPIIYPSVPNLESALKDLDQHITERDAGGGFSLKSGLFRCIMSTFKINLVLFGQLEFLDDMLDHWDTKEKHDEAHRAMDHLQSLARRRNLRVSFISGDVHVGGFGLLAPNGTPTDPKLLRSERTHMWQVVSSAIGNAPPPSAVVKLFQESGEEPWKWNEDYEMRMMKVLDEEISLEGILANNRNWCEVKEADYDEMPGSGNDGRLTFTLRVEDLKNKQVRPIAVEVSMVAAE